MVREQLNRRRHWIVDLDIKSYFDTIDHKLLMIRVCRRISDRRIQKLLRQWLEAGVMEEGTIRKATTGSPQGGVVSPLLANILLHSLDLIWEKRCSELGKLIRYVDDMVILCETKEKAEESLRRIGLILEHLGLGINAQKTRIVHVGDGKAGFDFLGFHFRKVESWRYRGRRYAQMWPGQKAMKAIRGRIKEITSPRWKLAQGISKIVKELNPVIRGWGNY